jgi:hypothetical protein
MGFKFENVKREHLALVAMKMAEGDLGKFIQDYGQEDSVIRGGARQLDSTSVGAFYLTKLETYLGIVNEMYEKVNLENTGKEEAIALSPLENLGCFDAKNNAPFL